MTRGRIRVLTVDDSAVARENYRQIIGSSPGLELAGIASSAEIARRKIRELDPDVVILDIDMPGTDGLTFLKWLMRNLPTPVVISSSLHPDAARKAMTAFSFGAIDVVGKGETIAGDGRWAEDFRSRIVTAIRAGAAAKNRLRKNPAAMPVQSQTALKIPHSSASAINEPRAPAAPYVAGPVVVIGASTGGTEAIAEMIVQMPPRFPPVFVCQHMPPVFTASFAERLNGLGVVDVTEASDGLQVGQGQVVVAPGGLHLKLVRSASGPACAVGAGQPVNRHMPSIDVLFESAARTFGGRVIGVLLTGMGADGAEGLLRIRQAGGWTIAQDEATSVVFGMPMEAIRKDAAEHVLPLSQIIPRIAARSPVNDPQVRSG